MIDVELAVRTWLLTESAVTDQVSTRIYCSPGIARSEVPNMPRKALTIYENAGPGTERKLPEAVANVQIRCYGATSLEARAVYNALHGVMQRASHERPATGQLLSTVHELSGARFVVEPPNEWPCYLSVWRIRYSTDTVTVG